MSCLGTISSYLSAVWEKSLLFSGNSRDDDRICWAKKK